MTRGRRRSYGTVRDATPYGGKLSTGDGPNFTRPAGVLAYHDGTCDRCDGAIVRHVSQVTQRKGSWVHVGCVNGADDE